MTRALAPVERRPSLAARHPVRGRRIRVLHLLNNLEIGGTERQAVELIKCLHPDRYDVHMAVLHNVGPLQRELSERFPEIAEFPVTRFYYPSFLRQALRLRSLMRRERIDILHAHDFYTGLLAVASVRNTHIRLVAAQRNMRLSDRRLHYWGKRITNRLAHRILVNSDAIRRHVLETSKVPDRKIVVIRNGLCVPAHARDRQGAHDELCRELGLPADTSFVGMVANFRDVKGHCFFIDAARRIAQQMSTVHFVLVGDGPLRGMIEAQAAQAGITDRMHLLGHQLDPSRLVAGFDVSVLASLHEGFPNSVMEAMAAGVAVVATDVGGVKELVDDGRTGFLVPPASAEALAERITRALTDADLRQSIAARGRQFVMSNLGMPRMVAAVEDLYQELLVEGDGGKQ